MGNRITGECLCKAVQFEIQLPTKWSAHCHCSMCRRAHGAAFVTWVGIDAERFSWITNDDLIRYESSPGASRSFCGKCGSTLLFESQRWAGEVHIARACLSGPVDRQPAAHVFFDDRVDWVQIADDLDRRGGTSGTEPLRTL